MGLTTARCDEALELVLQVLSTVQTWVETLADYEERAEVQQIVEIAQQVQEKDEEIDEKGKASLIKGGAFDRRISVEYEQMRHGRKSRSVRMANLSQHLAVKRSTNMMLSRKEGVSVFYRLADTCIMQAFDLITEVMLSNMAHEEELRREFALHLQDSASEV